MAEIVDFGLQQHKIKMDSRYFENVLSVVAGDTGRRIEVQLLDTNGMVQNTTGLNLRLNAVVEGKATFTDATLVDAATGKYQLDLSNGMFLSPGNWQFQWQITDSAGKKLHSFAFTGNVGKNISEGGSQATNFYVNLEDLKAMQEDLINGSFDSSILETNIAEKLTDLETQYAPKLTEVTAQLAQITHNVKSFGAKGDSVTDDSDAMKSSLEFVVARNGSISLEPSKTYVIKKNVVINTYGMHNFEFNLNGSTLDFAEGGNLTFNVNNGAPYKETVLQTDLIKGATNFDVIDAIGVTKGDLVIITSPVQWISGVPLIQTYTIGDVEGNKIYVDGIIVGDISTRQVQEAGLTGNIKVEFYKLATGFKLRNGMVTSKNRDAQSTMLYISGQDNYLIEDVTVSQPNRTGIYVQKSGTGRIVDCYTKDHGYTTKDGGYNSNSQHPDGLGFGYGFVFALDYMVHVSGSHSFSGWHGFDVAVGCTYAVFDNCVFHKDAFGISSHEGSWSLMVSNNKFLGGHAVMSRSAELYLLNNVMECNMGRAVIGNNSHQRLFIKGNIISTTGSAFWLVGSYPDYCYSLESPVNDMSDNFIMNMGAESKIRVRGKLYVTGNKFLSGKGKHGYTSFESLSGERHIIITNNISKTEGGQMCFAINGVCDYVEFSNNQGSVNSGIGSKALLYINQPVSDITINGNRVDSPVKMNIVRLMQSDVNFRSIDGNVNYYGVIVMGADSATTVQNLFNNIFTVNGISASASIVNENNNYSVTYE